VGPEGETVEGDGVAHLRAPAKLTLSLRILGRRPDGYHELEAEMVSLDLADELLVDPSGDALEVVALPGSRAVGLSAGPDNLVRRALAAIGRRAGVRLVKRIPVGGGLGGGSADAGAILRWAACADPSVAASLGADVPFCQVGGRAAVWGVGEGLSSLPYEARSFVLLVPPFSVDTGAVYRTWDQLMDHRPETIGDGPNDLAAPAELVEPRLGRWRDLFGEVTGREPVLAGSGSTFFVEGTPSDVGLEGRDSLVVGGQHARLVPVRTVPAGWSGEPADTPAVS
jgi:4-diphosphocytidyl-2-C-methyl-D-erythritol kinase